MDNNDFTTTFLVDETPKEVFDAVKNVREWWSQNIEGGTSRLNDEFVYRYKDIHYSKIKLIELIPNNRIVWSWIMISILQKIRKNGQAQK